ncbi:MAG: hypothetical protein MJ211_04230 [Bacteroidales bacterium]|nr:hypothetical protein [Bacteroidales bacterium]
MKQIFLILLISILSKFSFSQISFGGYLNDSYLTDYAIDTISGFLGIPDGYSINDFSISVVLNGFVVEEFSDNGKLTSVQKALLHKARPGAKIYIENLSIINNRTKKIRTENSLVLNKDGLVADLRRDFNTRSKKLNNPKIYVYPTINSSDTTIYKVTSFCINSIQPDFICNQCFEGDEIDITTFESLKKADRNFLINKINCIEVSTGNKYTVKPLLIDLQEDNYICRSKYFLYDKNTKISSIFLSQQNIDSTSIEIKYPYGKIEKFTFIGDCIPKNVKKNFKDLDLYSIMHITIYYENKNTKVDLMIVE